MTRRAMLGFNMIETLVAMVILSIGLLGIAGLQIGGVRANQGSYFRSQASAMMMDMVERIHNNVIGANAAAYAGMDFNSATAACGAAPTVCAQENGNTPGACNAAQMAAYDRYVMTCGMPNGVGTARVDRLADLLPSGRIRVQCINNAATPVVVTGTDCQPGFRHRIIIDWQERTQSAAAATGQTDVQTQTVTMDFQP